LNLYHGTETPGATDGSESDFSSQESDLPKRALLAVVAACVVLTASLIGVSAFGAEEDSGTDRTVCGASDVIHFVEAKPASNRFAPGRSGLSEPCRAG